MIESKSIENQLHDLDSKRKLFSEELFFFLKGIVYIVVTLGRLPGLVGTPSLRYVQAKAVS